ncbi:alpha/beta fold hydrolase [Stenotrophomonas pictorum]|uniref:alpha/beta fold hydrolase n=1 Tax=Stenotrophomonas pictorum TaxID=86184 RepID=UPI0012FD95DC
MVACPRHRRTPLPAFADALAAKGIAVFLHEWRGNGSSSLRPNRHHDWGYKELLQYDLPAAEAAIYATIPGRPFRLGGHSLGGQLGCCYAGLRTGDLDALCSSPAAHRGGAAFPHRAATCCHWPIGSCHGWRSAWAHCPAAGSASAAPRHAV